VTSFKQTKQNKTFQLNRAVKMYIVHTLTQLSSFYFRLAY